MHSSAGSDLAPDTSPQRSKHHAACRPPSNSFRIRYLGPHTSARAGGVMAACG